MKRYFIVFTVCMALMLVGLCVMLKFVCLGNLTRAAVAFVLMSVSGILSYLVYRTYDVIRDMKSHYEYSERYAARFVFRVTARSTAEGRTQKIRFSA